MKVSTPAIHDNENQGIYCPFVYICKEYGDRSQMNLDLTYLSHGSHGNSSLALAFSQLSQGESLAEAI